MPLRLKINMASTKHLFPTCCIIYRVIDAPTTDLAVHPSNNWSGKSRFALWIRLIVNQVSPVRMSYIYIVHMSLRLLRMMHPYPVLVGTLQIVNTLDFFLRLNRSNHP